MTGDDRLRAELQSLEEAAPVGSMPATEPVRRWPWRRGGLVGVTVIAGIAVTSLAFGFGRSNDIGSRTPSPGPSEPSATSNPAAIAETRVGDFVLTISSPKTVWAPEEAIEVSAALAYVGPQPSMTIGQGIPPILFQLQDASGQGPILRGLQLQPCVQYPLSDDEPLVEEFRKGVPFSSDGALLDSAPPFDRGFLDDPELHLPTGEWKFTANTGFQERDCGPDYSLAASIVLEVAVSASLSPAPSSPVTLEPSPTPLEPEGQVVEIGGIRATLPAGWDVRLPENPPFGAPHIVASWDYFWVSNQPMRSDCVETLQGTSCSGDLVIPQLDPGSVLMSWDLTTLMPPNPDRALPPGRSTTVGGYPAVVREEGCEGRQEADFASSVQVRVGDSTTLRVITCGRDVGEEQLRDIHRIFESVSFSDSLTPSTPVDDDPEEITGVLRGDRAQGIDCVWLTDPQGSRWEVIWPTGYRQEVVEGVATLSLEGQVVAVAGDTITVRGARSRDFGSVCMIGIVYEAAEVILE